MVELPKGGPDPDTVREYLNSWLADMEEFFGECDEIDIAREKMHEMIVWTNRCMHKKKSK